MTLLEKTYQHIKGITEKREQQLWKLGALDWKTALECMDGYRIAKVAKEKLIKELPKTIKHFNKREYNYFSSHLPSKEMYRLYPYMTKKVLSLDIETTGVKQSEDHLTVIGCYDGEEIKVFVHGENEKDFLEYIKRFSLVVTFNGSCFDMPFLEYYFETKFDIPQIDLRFVLKDLGYTGGLKKIELEVGINRGDDMDGVNGYTAVLLWRYYEESHDKAALDTLIHYNLHDAINLESLLILSYNEYAKKYSADLIEKRVPPTITYEPNKELVKYLHKNRYKYFR